MGGVILIGGGMKAGGRNADPSRTGSTRRRHPLRNVGEALLIWAGVCVIVLLPYEVAERLWLRELPSRTLGVMHILRDIMAALLATLATATYLRGRVLPSLQRSLDEAASADGYGRVEVREGLVTWFIGLRWIAVFVSAAVVGFATLASNRVPPESAPYLWAGVIALAAFNAVLSLLGPQRLSSQRALAVQVAGDVTALGWLIHHAGGLQNPFAGFFVFHAAIAAVVLEARPARRVAVAIASFVLALAAAEASVLPPGCLLGDAQGACPAAVDWMFHVGTGVGVAVLVVGCAVIVIPLMHLLHAERERLAQTSSALAARAGELVTAQTEVQQERERLQTIIDCMADAVLYVTPDGVVRLHNRAAQKFFPPEALSNGDLRACHPPETWKLLLEKVTAPEPVEVHPILQVNGRSYEASYARVGDADGNIHGVVMAARDITERIEAQQWRMQEERMAVVGKLAAALAHELNNPLGAIALFTQHALAEIKPRDPLAEYLGTVLRNANLCKKIVRDLLEYARQRPPERREVAVGELLGDVVRTLEPHAQRSGVAIRGEVNGQGDAFLYCDPDQMRQVLVNLGLNSIEAMPNGGALTFRLEPAAGGTVRVAVVDTGQGIPPEQQERIFTAFHTTKPEGTGLGLTVAQDVVAAHGGTIEVSSTPGEGSIFTVTLPAALPVEDRVPAAEASS